MNFSDLEFQWPKIFKVKKCLSDHKILHNDIKPQNYLVKFLGGQDDLTKLKIVLTDFGLVGSESRGGTPIFASPECLASPERRNKSDIFSLGRVFLFLSLSKDQFLELLFIPVSQGKQDIINEISDQPLLNLISKMIKIKDRIDLSDIRNTFRNLFINESVSRDNYCGCIRIFCKRSNKVKQGHTSSHHDIINKISNIINESVDDWTLEYISNLKHFS